MTGAEIDTVTGIIKVSKDLKTDKWCHLHDGYVMEELFHFKQLRERKWFGRTLSGKENKLLEDEVVGLLLNSGLERHKP